MSSSNAYSLHRELLATLGQLARVEERAVMLFAKIHAQRLYRELGYATMLHYAREALGFSRQRAQQFLALAESFKSLPALERAVSAGELPWTKAREVAKLATPKNEKRWIAEAKSSTNRQLEIKVRQRRMAQKEVPEQPGLLETPQRDLPAPRQRVGLDFAPEDFARFEAMIEQARKRGLRGGREEVLLALLEAGTALDAPRGASSSAYQIVVYQCEACGKSRLKTSRGMIELPRAAAERVACDARVLGTKGVNRSAIPPSTRKRVLARDGYRCRRPGCNGTNFLEVHHIKPRAASGSNHESNLITLCSACHQLLHERGSLGMGEPSMSF